MNLSTEESNLALYTTEITSELLTQNNESQELVQVSNICDDLLMPGLEDSSVTWTLGGLPILLNGQNDSQALLISQVTNNESLEDLQTHQETFEDILKQNSSDNQFVENDIETNKTEIIYPLEISDKNFLTDNGLFLTNDDINKEVDKSPKYELVSNDNEPLRRNEEILQDCTDNEIQSSNVSSQEAFIDINGIIISQQSILNLNCPDLLFSIQETQNNSSNVILNQKINKKLKQKRKIGSAISFLKNARNESVSDVIQNYKSEETVENEITNNRNSIFSNDESVNSLIKILSIDSSAAVLNIDGTLFNNKSITKDTSNIVAYNDEFPVDDEPDSTVANDLDDYLNIDDLATIITAYQCKKCDFTCNDKDEFLIHFKLTHTQTKSVENQIYEVQTNLLLPNAVEEMKNEYRISSIDFNRKQIKSDNKGVSTISILCTNDIPILNRVTSLEESLLKSEDIGISALEIQDDPHLNRIEIKPQSHLNNFHSTKVHINKEPSKVNMVSEEEFERKIMRVKKRKRVKKVNIPSIPQESSSFIPDFYLEVNTVENNENISNKVNDDLTTCNNNSMEESESGKQLIYLCSRCAQQFLTVEDCRTHMINDHNLCAVESAETTNSTSEENHEKEIKDPLFIGSDKNKKMIEKLLGQDVLKHRKHKCPIRGCPYRFAKLELLARHESCHVEGNRSQFRCPECGEIHLSWRNCSIHLWRCHQLDLDLFACPLCNYKGSTSVKLKHHIKIHSDEREYVCPECGRGFKQPSQLRNHRVIHLDNQPHWYTQKHCDKCGKMFADSKCLKKHIQAVHSKLKPFICNVCGHSCARKAMLQMHLRQHTGEKPYSCSLCFYKTGDHNSLRRHKMRHSGDRPYKCPHCDYTAIQSNSYKNHLASKHPGMSGAYNCLECPFKTVNKEAYLCHTNDHKKDLIDKKVERTGKVTQVNLLNILNNSNSELSNENDEIFTGSGTTGKNISNNKTVDIDDDETQNCFLSLSDITEEQTVDTGGITIPADPDPVHI